MNTEFTNQTNAFIFPVRVYYEDTDAGGVVYHSQYLNFMERARTEWLRELGFEQDNLTQELGIALVVRHLQIDYCKPARFNDRLQVQTRLTEMMRSYCIFEQSVWRQEAGDSLTSLTTATVKIACLSLERLRPVAIPTAIRSKLNRVD